MARAKKQNPREIIASLMKNERAMYEKAGIDRKYIIVFPHGKVPVFGRFGVWLAARFGGRVDVQYSFKK